MKNHSMVSSRLTAWCLAAGAFVLVSTAAFAAQKTAHKAAQTHPSASGQSAAEPNPSGHAKSIAVDHAGGNGVRHMDGGHWDCPLCGPRGGGPLHTGGAKAIAVDHAGGNGVRRMDGGNSGTGAHPAKADEKGTTGVNPLFEDKDKDAAKPPAKPAAKPARNTEPVEYKDPEDMTTRYRPGNNKTTAKGNPKASKGADSPH